MEKIRQKSAKIDIITHILPKICKFAKNIPFRDFSQFFAIFALYFWQKNSMKFGDLGRGGEGDGRATKVLRGMWVWGKKMRSRGVVKFWVRGWEPSVSRPPLSMYACLHCTVSKLLKELIRLAIIR